MGAAILAAGTIAVYRGIFAVPLLLDDNSSIAENASIRHLWPLWPVLKPPQGFVGDRPLINFSYALNYAFGGTSVFGYHLVNLIIHVLAALTLFALVRRTLRLPILKERFGRAANSLALAISAIWAWHPVVTESVTYLSQRAESLMGLFYLLTLYCFVRSVESPEVGRRAPATPSVRNSGGDEGVAGARRPTSLLFAGLSFLACALGTATKEVIVTAPIMVFLYDRTFVSGSFSAAWRRHWALLLALAATWIPLGYFMIGVHNLGVGLGQGASWWAYGMTECRVVVRYVLLSFWPHPLIFDYGIYVAPDLARVWPYVLVMAGFLVATILALRRSPVVSFAVCWFFLILAPVSSVVPVIGQPMAENRLYLPLAGAVALVVLGAFALAGRWTLGGFAVIAVGLGVASAERNRDYLSERGIWTDTLAKSPYNARAHNNLGVVLGKIPGGLNDAIAQFEEALRLKPDYSAADSNLGTALLGLPGRLDDAMAHLEEAVRLSPDFADSHNYLGEALEKMPGRLNDAIAQYEDALRLRPDYVEAHYNLGNALEQIPGRFDEAIAQYEDAIRLKPDYVEAHNNLGTALLNMPGRLDEAIGQLDEAVRLKPDFADPHNNLANALMKAPGRLDDAIAQYQEALRLEPDYVEAHYNLGNAYLDMPGRLNDAIGQYEQALRLKPDSVEAHTNLGNALLRVPGRLNGAIAQYEAALRLKPDYAEAHFNLGVALLKKPGGLAEAKAHFEIFARLEPDNEQVKKILAQFQSSPPRQRAKTAAP